MCIPLTVDLTSLLDPEDEDGTGESLDLSVPLPSVATVKKTLFFCFPLLANFFFFGSS